MKVPTYRAWRLSFYADSDYDKVKNKLFSFAVEDGAAAARLIDRFLFNDWRLRAVFMNYALGDHIERLRVPQVFIDVLLKYGFADDITRTAWNDAFPKYLP